LDDGCHAYAGAAAAGLLLRTGTAKEAALRRGTGCAFCSWRFAVQWLALRHFHGGCNTRAA